MTFTSDPGGTARPSPAGLAGAVVVGGLLGGWIAVSAFRPFTPEAPQPGLDGSWMTALGEAAERGLRWGPDLAFTYGPASPLVTGYFNASYLTLTLPLLLATCLLFGISTALLIRPGRPAALLATAAAAGLAAAFSTGHPDSLFLVLPLPPFLLATSRSRPGVVRLGIAAATAAAAGMVGMAKLSFPLAALPLFVLGDAAALLRRRAPVLAVPCLLGFLGADLLYGQSLADLPLFLRRGGEVVAGYGEAMSLDGSRAELLAFPLASAALVAIVAAAERAAPRRAGSRFAVPLGLAWVLLVLFKAGFVRQDAHTLIAWFGLALAAVLAAVGRLRAAFAGAVALAAVAGAGALGLTAVGPSAGPADGWADAVAGGRRILVSGPAAQVEAALDLARDPAGFADARRADRAARWRALAELAPLPRLDGGVDVIPSDQSRVMANGLDYAPRPSLQEYGTYTPALAAANRAFFEGPGAPAWVLFGPEPGIGTMTLDRRYPNFAEGALWLDLLRLYRPERRIGALAALRRRAEPAPLAPGEPRRRDVAFGDIVPVEPVGGAPGVRAVLATVEVRPTLLGRLAAFLYKPPPLTMRLRFADGHDRLYQFMSGIAAAGFVLSPRVDNASDFVSLAEGAPPSPGRIVTGLALDVPPRMRWLVAASVSIDLTPVSGGNAAPPAAPDSAWAALAAAEGAEAGADALDAPPPSWLAVPAAGLSRFALGFGLAPPGAEPPSGAVVCFAVRPVDGGGADLWRRCLDGAVAGDRAPQSVSLVLPPGTSELSLRTTCTARCGDGAGGYWAPPP